MTFIISNFNIENSEKVKDIYIKGNYVKEGSHLLIFEGFLYPDNNFDKEKILERVIEEGIDFLYNLKGYFCGIYYNFEESQIYFFTDKYGYFDLFFYHLHNCFIVSDNFNEILNTKDFSLGDIDKFSIVEFILFQYPLLEKTFIKSIKFVSLGTIYKFDLNKNQIEKIQYYDYKFTINSKINLENCIDKLDELFTNSINNIKRLNTNDSIYGIGLSGGMDSRLVAYYAIENNLKIKSFIFGEQKSDAYFIANKIAKLLKLEHYELGYDKDFFKYSQKSIKYNPMMDVLFTWYYAIFERIPDFDILLTGFNGDNQFGSHLRNNDLKIHSTNDFIKSIFKKYIELKSIKNIEGFLNQPTTALLNVKEEITRFLKNSPNSEFWQKIEEFNFKYRQRIYIKNNPSFNFYGRYKSLSIFIDPDLMEFLMTIPFSFRLNRRLFFEFLRRKIPLLIKIRPEKKISLKYNNKFIKKLQKFIFRIDTKAHFHFIFKKNHKNVNKWISNNRKFREFIHSIFIKENELFFEMFNKEAIVNLISRKKWNSIKTYIIFRFLTIKLFLDNIKYD